MIVLDREHHAADDLHRVHQILETKFTMKKRASADEMRARKMERYLRMFKAVGNQNPDKTIPKYQVGLEQQAMEEIANQVGALLGIDRYSLFRMQHRWYLDSSTRWGADDVFEAELAKLLEVAGEQALNSMSDINMGVSIIGGQTGNVSAQGLKELENLPNEIAKKFMQNGEQVIQKTRTPSNLISPPTFRSAKVDVTGYSAEWSIGAEIKPEWEDFIQTFTGARFTVKNYSSTSANEVIHIGNSDLYKAFYGTLTDTLNFQSKDATHIYYHTVNTDPLVADMGQHIIHIRFTYELTGNGLYDASGNRIDAADFFIYNDPASNNIWVRSTKAMIAQIMDYVGTVHDPLHSGIVLLKQSFK